MSRDDHVRQTPLVQFDVNDPALLTRWMARVPRRIRKAQHQRLYNLTHAVTIRERRRQSYRQNRQTELARNKARYEANREAEQAKARAKYHRNRKASKAALRARYAANPEKYRAAERERFRQRKIAASILVAVLEQLP